MALTCAVTRNPESKHYFSQVFSGLMTLRKLCNHPDLVTNDYCELRRLCNGEEEDGGEGGSFTTIDVSKEKKKNKRKCELLTVGLRLMTPLISCGLHL